MDEDTEVFYPYLAVNHTAHRKFATIAEAQRWVDVQLSERVQPDFVIVEVVSVKEIASRWVVAGDPQPGPAESFQFSQEDLDKGLADIERERQAREEADISYATQPVDFPEPARCASCGRVVGNTE